MTCHPHVIATNFRCMMTYHIASCDSGLENQLCTAPSQYLCLVIVHHLFVLIYTQVTSANWSVCEQ